MKAAAEFCARELGAKFVFADNVRPSVWLYWLPAIVFGTGLVVWNWTRHWRHQSAARSVRWLRITAGAAMALAMLVSVAHLALPLFPASPVILKLARQWCVRPELRADFDWLCQQPGANRCRIVDLLEHLNLASLQRGQFDASLPENDWRQFVLSPWLAEADGDIAWRRELWEWMAPRVRRETDAEQAAAQVVRQLQLRVGRISPNARRDIHQSWQASQANPVEMRLLQVAAFRAVGLAARLGTNGEVQIKVKAAWREFSKAEVVWNFH